MFSKPDCHAIVLCAGEGQRFKEHYKEIKPLIPINGKPMIQHVYESVGIDCPHTFVIRKQHNRDFGFADVIKSFCPHADIVEVDGLTEGAACTLLLAEENIKRHISKSQLVYNSDQIIKYDPKYFFGMIKYENLDGSILCFFRENDPKWSYCELGQEGYVRRVVEKVPISDCATVGVYWFNNGFNLLASVKTLIDKNMRHNNEFYFAPSYNIFIDNGARVTPYLVDEMHGVGTPEQLSEYLEYLNESKPDYQ